MRKPIYFPALSCTTANYLSESHKEILKANVNVTKSPRYFNNKGDEYFHHPYSLWSAAHHYNKFPDLRKDVGIDKDSMIFIDSGGYQLAMGTISEKNYNNKVALEWSEKNGDLFPILDRPLTKGCDFNEHLKLSVEAAQFYHENRSVEGTNILNVMSARNQSEMEHWYGEISKFDFEGWAHGGHKGNLKAILQGLLFLWNKGEFDKAGDPVFHHVFGISRMDAMLYFAVVQKVMLEQGANIQLTYDSSYFQRNLAFGGYFLFPTYSGIQQVQFSNKFDYSMLNQDKDDFLPCSCPVCTGVTDVQKFFDDPVDFYLLGTLHNLYKMLEYKHAVDSMVYMDIPDLLNSFPAQMRNNCRVIVEAFKNPKNGAEIIARKFIDKDIVVDTPPATLEDFMS